MSGTLEPSCSELHKKLSPRFTTYVIICPAYNWILTAHLHLQLLYSLLRVFVHAVVGHHCYYPGGWIVGNGLQSVSVFAHPKLVVRVPRFSIYVCSPSRDFDSGDHNTRSQPLLYSLFCVCIFCYAGGRGTQLPPLDCRVDMLGAGSSGTNCRM